MRWRLKPIRQWRRAGHRAVKTQYPPPGSCLQRLVVLATLTQCWCPVTEWKSPGLLCAALSSTKPRPQLGTAWWSATTRLLLARSRLWIVTRSTTSLCTPSVRSGAAICPARPTTSPRVWYHCAVVHWCLNRHFAIQQDLHKRGLEISTPTEDWSVVGSHIKRLTSSCNSRSSDLVPSSGFCRHCKHVSKPTLRHVSPEAFYPPGWDWNYSSRNWNPNVATWIREENLHSQPPSTPGLASIIGLRRGREES